MEILSVTHDSRKVTIDLNSKGVVKKLIFKICWDTDHRDYLLLDSTDIDGDFVLDDEFHQKY